MIVLCLGMPGSASTLVFNLVREILLEADPGAVAAVEATSLPALEAALAGAPPPRSIAIRAHTASDALLGLLGAAGAQAVPSARDPRDCLASLRARLGGSAVGWCTEVARSFAAVATVQARWGAEVLGYEVASAEGRALVGGLAARLGLALPAAAAARIAGRWTRGAVQARLERVAREAPPSGYGWRSDPATGLNEAHLGDGRIGKWRDALPEAERALVDHAFRGVGDPSLPAAPGRRLRFAEPLFGTAARPDGVGNLPAASSLGLRVLSLCFLHAGRWRVAIRGSLPAGHAPGRLHLVVGGQVRLSVEIPPAAPGAGAVAVPEGAAATFAHAVHEHQMELVLAGAAGVLPDPHRAVPLELDAVLQAG